MARAPGRHSKAKLDPRSPEKPYEEVEQNQQPHKAGNDNAKLNDNSETGNDNLYHYRTQQNK